MITEIADAGLHILYGALIWVCTLAALTALTLEAAAYTVYRAIKAWRGREARHTPASRPNKHRRDSRTATAPHSPRDARTAPPLWARTQPHTYEEAA